MDSFPSPLYSPETTIQPSRERVTANALPAFEIEVTSSRSETRLFRFFSPENTTAVSPRAHSQTPSDTEIKTTRMLFILSHQKPLNSVTARHTPAPASTAPPGPFSLSSPTPPRRPE